MNGKIAQTRPLVVSPTRKRRELQCILAMLFFCILVRVKIQTHSNFASMPRLLFAAVVALLLPACLNERASAPVEPASREYKLLLEPYLFDRSRFTATLHELDRLARNAAKRSGVACDGSLARLATTREVAFLDVPGKCTLRQKGLVLRLRSKGKKTTATLKYRTPHHAAIMLAENPLRWNAEESALEVDFKPPHESIYSHSLSEKTEPDGLQKLGDIHALFPSIRALQENPDTRLATVGNPVHEKVHGKVSLDLGSNGSMSLSLWYHATGDTRPAVAELSFKYATGKNSAADEKRARILFAELQRLEGWLSPLAMTKTAFVYASSPGFCKQE